MPSNPVSSDPAGWGVAPFLTLADQLDDAIVRFDADGRYLYLNDAAASLLGRPRAEVLGARLEEVGVSPASIAWVRDAIARAFQGEQVLFERRTAGEPSPESRWFDVAFLPERGADGTVAAVLLRARDVTGYHAAEEALEESEARFRALVERSSEIITIIEPDGAIRYISPAQERMLGYPPTEIIGRNAFELIHPADVARVRARFAEVAESRTPIPSSRAIRFRRHDGTWCNIMTVTSDLRDNPAVRGFVVNARDVTEELRLQEQLTQAQKMEALGQLAGGVAHDFNNILAAIAGYAELVLADAPSGSQIADDVREIARAAARGAGVTRQLLAFSRRQTLETEVLDLRQVVGDTGRMLRPLLPASIHLELPPEDGPPVRVHATRAQVEQILMNLAVNARDAMPAGGVLRVDLLAQRTRSGEEVVLVVSDSGEGMSEEVRSRAFEPFFTTKRVGEGTGLGLATVYGLVRQFGGRVEVQSAPGDGTTFEITLPIVGGVERAGNGKDHPAAPAPQRARILVAEDEPQLRTIVARALERAGYEVVTAQDGAAALAAIHDGNIDLMISDIAMPRLGGRELAAAVAAGFDALPVVLMSGYAELGATPEAERELPANVVAFIAKPFEIDRLVRVVGEALTRGGVSE